MNDEPQNKQVVEDPTTSKYYKQALLVAVVLIVLGIVALIIGKVIVGGIVTLLGAVFGLGSQVVKNLPAK